MANTHAIVIGGSMAGLCAARVLSGFYEKVTVIDRDAYPAGQRFGAALGFSVLERYSENGPKDC